MSEAGEDFIQKVRDTTHRRTMATSFNKVEIAGAQLGNRAGMLGAAVFALRMLRKTEK